jgi:DNA-binding response OmpR family regulator
LKKILIIEDESSVRKVIKSYLEREGYFVEGAQDGESGLKLFDDDKYDLVILDLMLPGLSGVEICKNLRNRSEVYIFILTSKGTVDDKIQGLNIGADEYLVKPFSPRELCARVNALFRRFPKEEKPLYDDGYLKIDHGRRLVLVGNKEINLTNNEYGLLSELVVNKGRVLSRERIIDSVFGMDFDGTDRTVDVHIKNIRKKIEEDTKNPKYVLTVIKAGYKFGGKKDADV